MRGPLGAAALLSGAALLGVGLTGCDESELARSCRGERVLVCPPYEWARVSEASVEPNELTPGDLSARARIQVTLERCDRAPAGHAVAISAVVPEEAGRDAGTRVEVFNVLTVRDGADGDPVAGDDRIDVEVVNPFGSQIPDNRLISLRFEALSRGDSECGSGSLFIDYTTGR